jgi:hypothetical protein
MLFNSYLRKSVVYVPTVVKLQTGAYVDVEPVAVTSVTDTVGLRRAFLDAIARKNAIVPPPPKDKWPPPVLLKYAGVKTWSSFARDASIWSIGDRDGNFQIIGYRDHPDGYWAPDSEKKIDFPPGSRVEVVIDRMIAILQDAARQQA